MHDFQPGVPPSGLFWLAPVPDHAFQVSRNGRRASLTVRDVPVTDSFQFLGPNAIPATTSLRVEWRAKELAVRRGKGDDVEPTDPAAFLGRFAAADAVGSFSGEEWGFSFHSTGTPTSAAPAFAELGRERNGAFLD